jgi:hypothetical protein
MIRIKEPIQLRAVPEQPDVKPRTQRVHDGIHRP